MEKIYDKRKEGYPRCMVLDAGAMCNPQARNEPWSVINLLCNLERSKIPKTSQQENRARLRELKTEKALTKQPTLQSTGMKKTPDWSRNGNSP